MGIALTPLSTQVTGDIRLTLFVLVGAVGFVMLIACANVANLLLAKAAGRQKEIAIRSALGASRLDVIRQLLTESLILGILGGIPGLLLAVCAVKVLTVFSPENIPHLKDVTIDGRVLVFTVLVSIITPMVFGLAPALQASRTEITETLKASGRSASGGAGMNRLRSLLVISEVALALVLLIASGLMLKSLLRLQSVNPGFAADNLITLELALPQTRYADKFQQIAFQKRLLERVSSIPGVQSVGTVDNLPFSGNESNSSFMVEGRPVPDPAQRPRAFYRVISTDYTRTMGIPLRQGRGFTDADNTDSGQVAIINETAAKRFWPNEDPIGKRLKKGRPESKNPWRTVVGVIGSVSHTALNIEPQPEIYEPYLQSPGLAITLVARAASAGNMFGVLRTEVLALDKDLPVSGIKLMTDRISNSVAQPRLYTLLLAVFGTVALVLAGVGVYGVISYSVTQRTNEMGLRMALGAQRADILRLIVGHAMLLVTIGLLAGLGLTLALLRLMSSLLYGVSATDPVTFLVVSIFLLLIGLVASILPAHRATKVSPMVALRSE
jgi:putative ABC transport system permease protein